MKKTKRILPIKKIIQIIVLIIVFLIIAVFIWYKSIGVDLIRKKNIIKNITSIIDESGVFPYDYELEIDYNRYGSDVWLKCDEFEKLPEDEQFSVLKELRDIVLSQENVHVGGGVVLANETYYDYGGDNYGIVTISKAAYDGIVTRVRSEKDNTIISDETKAECWTLAINNVKESLKSPSTAKFPSSYNSDGVSITRNDNTYYVSSYVDAENSFGAIVRTNFKVTIQNNYGEYSVTDIIIDE